MLGLAPFERKDFDLFNVMNDFEREFFGDRMHSMMPEMTSGKFRTDISETETGYLLEAELPGFKKEDISIDIDHDYLTVSAKREETNDEKNCEGKFIRRERYSGSFSRSFGISGVDPDAITAGYEDGILKVMMPKKSEYKRKLEIN